MPHRIGCRLRKSLSRHGPIAQLQCAHSHRRGNRWSKERLMHRRELLKNGAVALTVAATKPLFAWQGANNRVRMAVIGMGDRKSTRLNSSHVRRSYAVFCLKKKKEKEKKEEKEKKKKKKEKKKKKKKKK